MKKTLLLILILFSSNIFADIKYNGVQQKSSHNSYGRNEGILDQLVFHRLRSIEFDIYRSKASRPGLYKNWYVYHTPIFDTRTNCDKLSDCFKELSIFDKQQPNHEVVTVWFDIKDGFGGSRTPDAFDDLIRSTLGTNNIVTPNYLLSRCPGASNLKQAVSTVCSWPSLDELRGKWIFVLTNSEYSANRPNRLGFTAQGISNKSDVDRSSRIFFNTSSKDNSLSQYIYNEGFVSRRYILDDKSSFNSAISGKVHHIATNKINYIKDSWAKTHNNNGWPFRCLSQNCSTKESSENIIGINVNSEDIWGSSDNFVFLSQNKGTANGRWIAAINTPSSHVDEWAKGCIMARVSKNNNSPYFALCRPSDNNQLRVQWRDSYSGDAQAKFVNIGGADGISQRDLTHVKVDIYSNGKCAVGLGSRDGKNWTKIFSRCFSEPLSHQGLAASSHGNREVKHLFSNPTYWGTQQRVGNFTKTNIGTVRKSATFNGSF